jgi:prophage regulatory protein
MTKTFIPTTIIATSYVLLRLPEVKARTGYCRSQIYHLIKLGTFPAPVKLGVHASAWVSTEVDQWIVEHIAERDAKAAA